MKFHGEFVYLPGGDFVGFHSTVKSVEPIGDTAYLVTTEVGSYILQDIHDMDKIRVSDLSGKSIFELQNERRSRSKPIASLKELEAINYVRWLLDNNPQKLYDALEKLKEAPE